MTISLRGQHEILEQIRKPDPSGAVLQVLVPFLDYEHVRQYELVSERVTADIWGPPKPRERSYVEAKLIEALETGITKATSHNGAGARRNAIALRAYLWLLGDDEALAFVDDATSLAYSYYGCLILVYLAKRYNSDVDLTDKRIQRMARGEPCVPNCDQCLLETLPGDKK